MGFKKFRLIIAIICKSKISIYYIIPTAVASAVFVTPIAQRSAEECCSGLFTAIVAIIVAITADMSTTDRRDTTVGNGPGANWNGGRGYMTYNINMR